MHEGRSPPYESSTLEVILQPSPFGVLKPAVPTAQSVTISRIASPLSVDKTFEQACLEGLRRYLQVRSRLLKKGDMIAVAIDTDYKQEPDESEVELEINTELVYPFIAHTF